MASAPAPPCQVSRSTTALLLLALAAAGPLAEQALAQSARVPPPAPVRDGPEAGGVVDLPRLQGPIHLDGIPDEPAWAAIEPLTLTMYEPTYRGSSDRRIALRMAYDDEAIWLAASFHHEDPSSVRAFSLTRDRWSGDDSFGILIDTFNDKQNAVRFVGMPLGARMDMSISGDGEQDGGGSGGPRGNAWNTFWDLEARITEDGWHGEMRIPFSSLRFETRPDGSVVMGMLLYAYEPAQGIRWTWPAVPPQYSYQRVSSMQEVRLRDVEARNPVYVSPYVLGSALRSTALNPEGTAFRGRSEESAEVGLDLKYNPTPNLTLDLSVNTDFAAVEADQQQVNLTRFSLFFEEKRPFFQERAGIFAFETGADRGTLFYSRRIGLAGGQPVRILGGARLVGRLGSWDVGGIQMQTAREGELESENFGVLRLRRRVWNENSFAGGMLTSRVDAGGGYNVTYGIDGQFRVRGNEYLTLKWLQTFQGGDEPRDAAASGVEAGRVVFDWTRRQLQGFSYRQAFTWSGAGYDPGVGFEPRSDFMRVQSDWDQQWYPGEDSAFRRVWLGLASSGWVRNGDRELDTSEVRPFLQLETKPGSTLQLSVTHRYEDVPEAFSLSEGAGVPAGVYRALEGELELEAARGWSIRPNVTFRGGEFYDGRRTGIETSLTWPVNRYLELGGGWEWNRIRFEERDQEFESTLVRFRGTGAASTRASMNWLVQYNSLTDQVNTNARFRYNVREGQDLWIVWNEALNTQREVPGLPRLPFEEARTLTVKYTHTLVF